jgi:hypothetical protein
MKNLIDGKYDIGGILYDIYDDGTATVAGYTNDLPNAVSIPATISLKGAEYTVDCIGESCEHLDHEMLCRYNSTYPRTAIVNTGFRGCGNLESIVIPDSVTTIGIRAFLQCENLKSVEIPSSVTVIGRNAFMWCRSLKSLVIPDSVTIIGAMAFSSCKSLEHIVIPDSVTTIGDLAFLNCKKLEHIVMPNSVKEIGYDAFYGCPNR